MSEKTYSLADSGFLTKSELKEFLHIKGDSTILKYVKNGILPKPKIVLSNKRQWWDKNEVIEYLDKNNKK